MNRREWRGRVGSRRRLDPRGGRAGSEVEVLAEVELARLRVVDEELAAALGEHPALVEPLREVDDAPVPYTHLTVPTTYPG